MNFYDAILKLYFDNKYDEFRYINAIECFLAVGGKFITTIIYKFIYINAIECFWWQFRDK